MRQNFFDGWEAEGASVAVFVKGQKVADLWGGYADIQAARTWKKVSDKKKASSFFYSFSVCNSRPSSRKEVLA